MKFLGSEVGEISLTGLDTCHEQVLKAAKKIVEARGKNSFKAKEIRDLLERSGTEYSKSTINTHISSRCCTDARNHHRTTYDYFEKIEGKYKLNEKYNPL